VKDQLTSLALSGNQIGPRGGLATLVGGFQDARTRAELVADRHDRLTTRAFGGGAGGAPSRASA
jgi:hypothetical protein